MLVTGFSCRCQLKRYEGVKQLHPAEDLAGLRNRKPVLLGSLSDKPDILICIKPFQTTNLLYKVPRHFHS